jgi:uncharacterized membrane-anchored protein YhcB (DUF1043 family)
MRTRYAILVDTVVGSVIAALVLGFFVVLWQGFEKVESSLNHQKNELSELKLKVEATGAVTSEEVAKLRTGIRRLEEAFLEIRTPEELLNDIEEQPENRSALNIQKDVQKQIYDRVQMLKK